MIIHRYMHDGSTIHALELMVAKAMYQNANIKLQAGAAVQNGDSPAAPEFIQCTDFAYCDMWMQLHTESRCIVTNDPYCPICMDEHRDHCGECTLHLEQQREQILQGTPVLDLEAWGKDQQ